MDSGGDRGGDQTSDVGRKGPIPWSHAGDGTPSDRAVTPLVGNLLLVAVVLVVAMVVAVLAFGLLEG